MYMYNQEVQVICTMIVVCIVDLLLEYLNKVLKHQRLLDHITGNPRSLKRICNITMLSIHCYPEEIELTEEHAFALLLVIIMVEQWPFR